MPNKRKKSKSTGTRNRPKRPLSAYNLFYRFKRAKILEAHNSSDGELSKEVIRQLILTSPGLEGNTRTLSDFSTKQLKELRQTKIRSALQTDLSAHDAKKRSHRKTHGCISFVEMNKIMCHSWKAVDDIAKDVFQELANEGRKAYHQRLAKWKKDNRSTLVKSRRPKREKKTKGISVVPPSSPTSLSIEHKAVDTTNNNAFDTEPLTIEELSYGHYVKTMSMSTDTQYDGNRTPSLMELVADLDKNPSIVDHGSNAEAKASAVSPDGFLFEAGSADSGRFDDRMYVRVVSGDSISTKSSLEQEPLPFLELTETSPDKSDEELMNIDFPSIPDLVQMKTPETLDEFLPTPEDNYDDPNKFNALSCTNQRVSVQDFMRLISTLESS